MNVYEFLVSNVQQGKTFQVDFENKRLVIENKEIITNGEYDSSVFSGLIDKPENAVFELESLYHNYKYSYPSEADVKASKRAYFKALKHDEMTDMEIIVASDRRTAQAKLEGFILCASLAGYLTWDESYGGWFWQSETDPDLVVLKKWVA